MSCDKNQGNDTFASTTPFPEDLKTEAFGILKQAIGMGPVNDAKEPYRNHFVSPPGRIFEIMIAHGYLVVGRAGEKNVTFHVTTKGLAAIGVPLPPSPVGKRQEIVEIGGQRVPTFDTIPDQ